MGSAAGTLVSPVLSQECAKQNDSFFFAFKVLKFHYDQRQALATGSDADDGAYSIVQQVTNLNSDAYQKMFIAALLEKDVPIEQCQCSAVVLYKYYIMSATEKAEFCKSVIECAELKEKRIAKKAALEGKKQDYSQSFGGTEQDTKNEKEAAAILRGDGASKEDETSSLYPFLVPPLLDEKQGDVVLLRKHGRWVKVLGGTGCYLYVHALTKEVLSIRPNDFEDDAPTALSASGSEQAQQQQQEIDISNGLSRVDLEALPAEVERIVSEGKKTPLLVDTSKSGAVRAFYTYKGVLQVVYM
jgi:hypothetical protein